MRITPQQVEQQGERTNKVAQKQKVRGVINYKKEDE